MVLKFKLTKNPRFYMSYDKELIVLSNFGFLIFIYGIAIISCLIVAILIYITGGLN